MFMDMLSCNALLREKVVMVMADSCKLTLPDMCMEQVYKLYVTIHFICDMRMA